MLSNKRAAVAILNDAQSKFVAAANAISTAAGDAALCLVDPMKENTRAAEVAYANSLARAVLSAPEPKGWGSGALEQALPVQRLLAQLGTSSLSATLLSAHELGARRKYAEGLERYLDAYGLDPEQPLTCLCIACNMIFLAHHPLVKRRHDVLLKALAFMDRYRTLRLRPKGGFPMSGEIGEEFEQVTEDDLRQETLYNFGRIFQELQLNHLAVDFYTQLLRLVDERAASTATAARIGIGCFDLSREAAHNLALLYRGSGSMALALQVTRKYLTI